MRPHVPQIGVDFGGTEIEAAALSRDGRIAVACRAPTPTNYEAALTTVCDLVGRVEAELDGLGTIGVGCPGSISPRTGLMRNANSTWLNGKHFQQDLEAALARPVRLANDANCLALSEAVDGAAAGAKVTFAVIIGTGCGGGIAINARLVEGANSFAGEWGHNPLPWPAPEEAPGPTCWCGRQGCLETWVSGTGFWRDFHNHTGRDMPGEQIMAAARNGDAEASAAFERYLDRLGRALAVVCNIVDPDVIVFGGGLSNISELYGQLPCRIAPHVFSDEWSAVLAPARWGDSSGVRGAARLWSGD
ncbi:MAG TPA: ROK family protein [Sphingomonadaceae bacterium]|nr:ROK family protein [Sphingomonadaceae bacterium]